MSKTTKAAAALFAATAFWGTSFILTKALAAIQTQSVPDAKSWLITSLALLLRFTGGAIVVALWNARLLSGFTRLEFRQGLGLGAFGGVGILLQMDGVLHTKASTCAFLTQCYCVFIPVFLVWRRGQWPAARLALSCVLVLAGVWILSDMSLSDLRLGRGEWETLASSVFFTGQILWLERKAFAPNQSGRVTIIMFVVTALLMLPTLLASGAGPRQWSQMFAAPSACWIILFLTLGCTAATYSIMNKWQPHVPATEAGLIYCCEPVFTALFALVLPGWLQQWANIAYPNERLDPHLLAGGGLITAANLLMLLRRPTP